jgi:predicted ATP-grasp superfamily ATP-dependent carboligase
VTWNREEFENVSKMVKGIFGADVSYIISEFIQDVRATLDCSFYVTKSGRIIWIGVQECVMEGYGYVAGTVDWHLQEQYRERLYDKYVVPVAAYLHKKGYFGIVGIDIITSQSGDYLTDLNPRLNGNTQFIMLAASMAKLGLSKSLFQIHVSFDVSGEQLVKKANSINETSAGRVVIIASADEDEKCYAAVSVSADSMKLAESLYASLCSKD